MDFILPTKGLSRNSGALQIVVAHSMLVAAAYILSRDEPYEGLEAGWLTRRNDEVHSRRAVELDGVGKTFELGSLSITAELMLPSRVRKAFRSVPRVLVRCPGAGSTVAAAKSHRQAQDFGSSLVATKFRAT